MSDSPRPDSSRGPIKVLLLENIHPTAKEMFLGEGFVVEALTSALKPEELKQKLQGVNILGIRSKTQVRAEVLAEAKSLMSLGCFCIGTNQVDLGDANKLGVPVFNAPFSNTRSVAELIIAEIVALSRQLGDRSREVHEGKWRKVAVGSFEIRGKTLGIIGYGHIGSQLGILAEGMGMRVVFYDVATKLPLGNVKACDSLNELLAQSDFVTLHVPETQQTKNMFGAEQIAQMRKGAYLLNASRGTVVDVAALAEAIKSGHIAGAAVDVYPEEPEANGDTFKTPLQGLPNVILTPHIGGSTTEAQASIGREVATSLIKFVSSGASTGAVNFPQVELPQIKGTHRIMNVHRNVPGVMRDINRIVAGRNANIRAQMLSTDANIGYLIIDMDEDVSGVVLDDISQLKTSIQTRIVR